MEFNQNELKIFKLFLNNYLNDKYLSFYNNKSLNYDFTFKYMKKIPFNICVDISNEIKTLNNKDLLYTIVYNALLYAEKTNKRDFISCVKSKKDIFEYMESNFFFYVNVVDYCLRFLNIKHFKKISQKEYIKLLNITNNVIKTDTIVEATSLTDTYRKILFSLLDDTKKESFNVIEDLIKTNKYDQNLKVYNADLFKNQEDIKFFKAFIVRIIISDSFILASSEKNDFESSKEDYEEYDEIDYSEDINSYEFKIVDSIVKYVDSLDKIILPDDDDLRFNMYSLFLEYNSDNKLYDFTNFKSNTDNIKKIKKINPLYLFDKIN